MVVQHSLVRKVLVEVVLVETVRAHHQVLVVLV
jgi:hypothetical protein